MRAEHPSTFLLRNVRFLWLVVLFLTPAVAFLAYDVTSHEKLWQPIVYSLLCVPLFVAFILACIGAFLSFLMHRIVTDLLREDLHAQNFQVSDEPYLSN